MKQLRKKKLTTKGTVVEAVAPAQLKKLPRPRGSFDSDADGLMKLYREHEKALFIEGFDPDAVLAERAKYRALDAQAKALRVQLAKIEDARFVCASHVWVSNMLVYERLRSAGRTNPDLQREVAPFEERMKTGRRKKPVAPKPPVAQ